MSTFYRSIHWIFIFALVLVACSQTSSDERLRDELPLDSEHPTLVMFYTDN